MSNAQIVLAVIVLQQGFFALIWWIGGWVMGLSRRAAGHWMLASGGAAAAFCLLMMRGRWPDALSFFLGNLLLVAAFASLRRGLQLFVKPVRTTDLEHLVLLLATAAVLALVHLKGLWPLPSVVGVSLALVWVLLRAAHEAYRGLQGHQRRTTVWVVVTPLVFIAGVLVLRVVGALLRPEVVAVPLTSTSQFNVVAVLVFLVIGMVMNFVLGYMVLMRFVGRLQRLSQNDPLTGLLNRRAFRQALRREAERTRRYGGNYAVLLIDLDHFKRINDDHGHAAGDNALVAVAQTLKGFAREVDAVGRLGGEEFCLLLSCIDQEGAHGVAERLRQAVAGITVQCRGPLPRLSASVGVAVPHQPDEPMDLLLHRADLAMYQAKAQGRDRVVVAEPPDPAARQASLAATAAVSPLQ